MPYFLLSMPLHSAHQPKSRCCCCLSARSEVCLSGHRMQRRRASKFFDDSTKPSWLRYVYLRQICSSRLKSTVGAVCVSGGHRGYLSSPSSLNWANFWALIWGQFIMSAIRPLALTEDASQNPRDIFMVETFHGTLVAVSFPRLNKRSS